MAATCRQSRRSSPSTRSMRSPDEELAAKLADFKRRIRKTPIAHVGRDGQGRRCGDEEAAARSSPTRGAREKSETNRNDRRSRPGGHERQRLDQARRIVVKIGSALLVDAQDGHAEGRLARLARRRSGRRRASRGKEVIVVSSGAIALGRRSLGLRDWRAPARGKPGRGRSRPDRARPCLVGSACASATSSPRRSW